MHVPESGTITIFESYLLDYIFIGFIANLFYLYVIESSDAVFIICRINS